MIKLADQQIKEIAENLDCGMKCFFNKQTGEIKTLLDFDNQAQGVYDFNLANRQF